MQKLIGQTDTSAQAQAVEIAVTHYIIQHAQLTNMTIEAARAKIEDIVTSCMYGCLSNNN